MLLEKLCNEAGVSGDELIIANILKDELISCCDTVNIDYNKNLTAYKRGRIGRKKIMIAAHMDEVGMIVTDITDTGYIKFKTVGGIDPRVLLSKQVIIGAGKVPGITGIKAIHMQTVAERKEAVKIKNMYIDIGASSKKEAEGKVSLGDYISFPPNYREFGDGFILSKALDDRAGCAIAAELLKDSYDSDIYGCFTVQEEIGCRGAITAANKIKPDIALVIETTICGDVGETSDNQKITRLGKGPAISLMDSGTLYDKNLINKLIEIAKEKNINFQYKQSAAGGNDSKSIQLCGTGVPIAAISIPCRNLHSPGCVISKADYDGVLQLAGEFIKNIN